jgi:hypothetical protein
MDEKEKDVQKVDAEDPRMKEEKKTDPADNETHVDGPHLTSGEEGNKSQDEGKVYDL